jgi:hypothetical protein
MQKNYHSFSEVVAELFRLDAIKSAIPVVIGSLALQAFVVKK